MFKVLLFKFRSHSLCKGSICKKQSLDKPRHNFKAEVTFTDATDEFAVKQLDDVHNTSWNTVGLQNPGVWYRKLCKSQGCVHPASKASFIALCISSAFQSFRLTGLCIVQRRTRPEGSGGHFCLHLRTLTTLNSLFWAAGWFGIKL